MKNFICITALLASSLAFAAPKSVKKAYIDPALLRHAQSHQESRITVIVTFKGALNVDPIKFRRSNHQDNQLHMIELNDKNVEEFKSFLATSNLHNANIKLMKLWIINGVALKIEASELYNIANSPNVEGVYPNHKVRLLDSKAAHDHGRVSAKYLAQGGYTYGLEKINLPKLREKAPTLTGKGVRVGILDTGIDASHPDLKGRLAVWKDIVEKSDKPVDPNGHGTHVAGTISGGAASGTAIGIAPEVSLVVGRIFGASGSTTWDVVLSAMQWITDPDGNPSTNDFPALVSNSWGGGAPNPTQDPANDPLCKAVSSWTKLGMMPVFAAGNSGPGKKTINLPGGCPDAVTVGATDENDAIAGFSSRGPAEWKTGTFIKPVVSAPGVKVISSFPNGTYRALSGTSMATPHVAGMTALLYQLAPNANVLAMRQLLESTSKDLGEAGNDNVFGFGRIDSLAAASKLIKAMR